MQRPDLSNLHEDIIAYIEYLEKKAGIKTKSLSYSEPNTELDQAPSGVPLPIDHDTTTSILTISHENRIKRTYRHLITRQHRGGMGMFGIDIDSPDFPTSFASCGENQNLLIFTNQARVYRMPSSSIPAAPLFAKGSILNERSINLEKDEIIVAVLPEQAKGYIAMVSAGGRVRCLRHHLFGEHMRPGTSMFNPGDYGELVSACWTPGDAELFIITQQGMGIRFAEKAISPQGDQAIRLSKDDRVISITSVEPDSNVFIISADGRGTIRMMSGFTANKSPGGSGKIAIKSNKVVGAITVEENDDIFLISRIGKIIRFPSDEVSKTEGVVQGVICMSLRSDEVTAMSKHGPVY